MPRQCIEPPSYIYGNLRIRAREYAMFVLLHRDGLPPVALRRQDLGNEGYDTLLATRRILPVPPGAERVIQEIDRLLEWNPDHANAVLRALWQICDPEEKEMQPDDSFGLCLQVLVQFEIKALDISRLTAINIHRELHNYIQHICIRGWFDAHDFTSVAINVLEFLNETIQSHRGTTT
jgi:hypothetical protein